MFLKSKGFLRNTGHWKKHGFETFSGSENFEKRDNIARWSARHRRATKVIFFKICAHYGKNAPLRARRVGPSWVLVLRNALEITSQSRLENDLFSPQNGLPRGTMPWYRPY